MAGEGGRENSRTELCLVLDTFEWREGGREGGREEWREGRREGEGCPHTVVSVPPLCPHGKRKEGRRKGFMLLHHKGVVPAVLVACRRSVSMCVN